MSKAAKVADFWASVYSIMAKFSFYKKRRVASKRFTIDFFGNNIRLFCPKNYPFIYMDAEGYVFQMQGLRSIHPILSHLNKNPGMHCSVHFSENEIKAEYFLSRSILIEPIDLAVFTDDNNLPYWNDPFIDKQVFSFSVFAPLAGEGALDINDLNSQVESAVFMAV